jgi:hypothetical protein
MMQWLKLAATRSVVLRSINVALVVGLILVAINHGEAILRGEINGARIFQIGLTVLVPYCVSTYASVGAMREEMDRNKS